MLEPKPFSFRCLFSLDSRINTHVEKFPHLLPVHELYVRTLFTQFMFNNYQLHEKMQK